MISIDSLNIQLPGQMQNRAQTIALLVADQLAQPSLARQLRGLTDVTIAQLALQPLTVAPHHSDNQIAAHIAQHIGRSIAKQAGGQS